MVHLPLSGARAALGGAVPARCGAGATLGGAAAALCGGDPLWVVLELLGVVR